MEWATDKQDILLRVEGLYKVFPQHRNLLQVLTKQPEKLLKAVDHVSLEVVRGEILGLVGESGCGKSTFAKSMIRLLEPNGGTISFDGVDLTALSREAHRKVCKNFQVIFQDPYSSLNPRMTIGKAIEEVLLYHHVCDKLEVAQRCKEIMRQVGLDEEMGSRYPRQLSGGQRQRAGIARAVALHPKLIIADEPVSALDVSIQAQILNLLLKLKRELNCTMIFISHDLRVVRYISDRVAVMYLGKIVELAPADELYQNTAHPYSQILMQANPSLDPRLRKKNSLVEGELTSPIDLPTGCRFRPRCSKAVDICSREEPELRRLGPGHFAACHYISPNGSEIPNVVKKGTDVT